MGQKRDTPLVIGGHKFVTFLKWRKIGTWKEVGWNDLELESGSTDSEEGPKGRELGGWQEGLQFVKFPDGKEQIGPLVAVG